MAVDFSAYVDFTGLIIGMGLGVPALVKYVSQVTNLMSVDHANAVNSASLATQADTRQSAQIAQK